MSNGQQIGGAVGAVVGGVIGFFTVGVAQGAQWGYAIGSAIGGYVDPTKVYGPKLTDASAQTSTVGGVIPFGYGVFTCAGNIIWADELKEHRKSERVGKGGSQKNITYTYTRSYAIAVCEGEIYNYIWIKENGKLVYCADPVGLGAAMGWSSQQIADLTAASAKFLQQVTLYRGTDSQMPDSTIVAVEGVGNVSAFRDIAYIVRENQDLTDMQGAVSQHEFCVRATAPEAYLTSPPYPLYQDDFLSSTIAFDEATLKPMVIALGEQGDESVVATISLGEALLRPPIVPLGVQGGDGLESEFTFGAASIRAPVVPLGVQGKEILAPGFGFGTATQRVALVKHDQSNSPEKLQPGITLNGADLYVP